MIIPVKKENLNEWAALCEALWPEDIPGEAAADFIEEWENGELPNEFIYYADGQAVGFISLALRHDYVEGTETSPVGYLEGIYVAPGFRKRGIARQLVEFAKEWTLRQGCTELASDVELPNEASILFHGQMGFEEVNRVVCFAMRVGQAGDIWKNQEEYKYDKFSLHDCRVTSIVENDGNIELHFSDGFYICESHPENPYSRAHRTNAACVTLLNATCESIFHAGKKFSWNDFCSNINAGKWRFECLTECYADNRLVYEGLLHDKHGELNPDAGCNIWLTFQKIVCKWNIVCEQKAW